MKFSEMKYTRPDKESTIQAMQEATERLKKAGTFAEANQAFVDMDRLSRSFDTQATLASIRHSIDTRDSFYDEENRFFDQSGPELQEYNHNWHLAMMDSPFREEFTKEYGELLYKNIEISLRSFSPEIIADSQKENELTTEYEKLLASAQIPFEDGVYTISQMTAFKQLPEDDRRLKAWQAEGQWYKDNQNKLDSLYDELVKLRDAMGRTMGHKDYVELGYDRMGRNCYSKEDVAVFRQNVIKYLVPVAEEIYKAQAGRLGKSYPLNFADAALQFRTGNPKPVGTEEDIVAVGKRFYDELSPETSEFFNTMLEGELMDLSSKPGKRGGGYCTSIFDYGVPFIFANFNGTQGDVEVITHEAGHAFAGYINRDRIPHETIWPSMEGCEVHSMSMEFFAETFSEDFFGEDADKFLYSHLAGAITFIPYGTMVDHFQHIVYENPTLTPAERHGEWKKLIAIYMPWMKLDSEIPFYGDGENWQRQHHIYSMPFYYIDYCLAQTVALQFWSRIQDDRAAAFEKYMLYTRQGGSDTFTNMLKKAGLDTPFEESCLKDACAKAAEYLKGFKL